MIVCPYAPTAAAAVNERCWLRLGALAQLFVHGLKVTTSVVVNGLLNGFPPPIDQNRTEPSGAPVETPPAPFFAVGMLAACPHPEPQRERP
jgi:hypothetical protein